MMYNVFACFRTKIKSFEPLEVEFELEEQFWIFQNLACPLERGKRRSSGKYELPEVLHLWMLARVGRFSLERGAM